MVSHKIDNFEASPVCEYQVVKPQNTGWVNFKVSFEWLGSLSVNLKMYH